MELVCQDAFQGLWNFKAHGSLETKVEIVHILNRFIVYPPVDPALSIDECFHTAASSSIRYLCLPVYYKGKLPENLLVKFERKYLRNMVCSQGE
jgi:hypothetical protein